MERKGYREELGFLMELHPGKAALTVKEAANVLGTSTDAVYDAIKRKKDPVPHKSVGKNRIVIPIAGLARWLAYDGT